jgi:hypothetical protein
MKIIREVWPLELVVRDSDLTGRFDSLQPRRSANKSTRVLEETRRTQRLAPNHFASDRKRVLRADRKCFRHADSIKRRFPDWSASI